MAAISKKDRKRYFRGLIHRLMIKSRETELSMRASSLSYDLLMAAIPLSIVFLQVGTIFLADPMSAFYDAIRLMPETISAFVSNILRILVNSVSGASIGFGIFTALWLGSNGINKLILGICAGLGFSTRRNVIFRRITSFFFTFLFIVSIILLLVLVVFSRGILHLLAEAVTKLNWHWLSSIIAFFSSFAIKLIPATFLFLTLLVFYRSAPLLGHGSLGWRPCVLASILATLGIFLLTGIYGYILDNISKMSIYFGSFAGILGLFVWLKYVSVMILLGAEIIAVGKEIRSEIKK